MRFAGASLTRFPAFRYDVKLLGLRQVTFLLVCPGITVKDRLRELLPSDPDNYYEKRGIVLDDMIEDR